ncbi:hypothetical protein CQW23_23712 [Capsicum baccatum]|uniref:Uncharacterized protein n=1 Tax=Capsicum baccatum TaxID=33114 RepID=A0A2G2VSS1_CAPBA|nr:hypothetical protein CQW23_23712 [Capsicum baccatum]
MLNRAIEYEGAILNYVDHDIGLAYHLEFGPISIYDSDIMDDDKQPVGTLLSSDWDSVKRIAKFLKLFSNLTLKMFGYKAGTIEQYLREYIKSLFDEYSKSTSKDNGGNLSSIEVDPSSLSSMVVEGVGDFYEELSRHTFGSGAKNLKSELDKYQQKILKLESPILVYYIGGNITLLDSPIFLRWIKIF